MEDEFQSAQIVRRERGIAVVGIALGDFFARRGVHTPIKRCTHARGCPVYPKADPARNSVPQQPP